MNILFTDFETYSEVKLKRCGSYKYAENCEVMLVGFALNDEEPIIWDKTLPGIDFSAINKLRERIGQADIVVSHNSMFDRVVAERKPYLSKIFRGLPWGDSMVKALSHSLPGGLKILSEIFNLKEEGKDSKGRDLVLMFCVPQKTRKIKRCTSDTHPEEWKQFKSYLRRDIISMRLLCKKIPSWNMNKFERKIWEIDQKINDRGFFIDKELAEAAIKALEKENRRLKKLTYNKTQGVIDSATRRDEVLKYIFHVLGVQLPNLQKATIERRLQDPDIPEDVKELLRIRLESSGTGTTKYQTALDMTCKDGRVHGALQFNGAARTGRWGGRGIQPQNFARPVIDKDDIETGTEAIKLGIADRLFPSVKDVALSVLRGIIRAEPGKKLVVADYKSIEGVSLPWLAGDIDKVSFYDDVFTGLKEYGMYEKAYSDAFKVDPSSVTKDQRQIGKTMELALGYGGGVKAFVVMATTFGINLTEMSNVLYPELDPLLICKAEEWYDKCPSKYGLTKKTFVACDVLKRMWRQVNPKTVQYWYDLERAVRSVINNENDMVAVRSVIVDKKNRWLRIRLPSGRFLSYPGIKLIDNSISYLGMDTYTKQWCRIFTHGGKLAENITQAHCADQLKYGIYQAEENGYPIILSVHDEPIAEVPDSKEYTVDRFCELITRKGEWAAGCPVAAEGFEAYRYRKG